MNSVSAVSMPFASDGAREALSNPGVAGIAAMAVEGFGRQQGHTESSRNRVRVRTGESGPGAL